MTTQELPERRTCKIDLNLLPAEYLPKKKSPWGLVMVLLVVVLTCAPWPFLIMWMDVSDDNSNLEDEKTGLQTEVDIRMAKVAEAVVLEQRRNDLQDQWNAMLADEELFKASQRTWSEIMFDVQQLPRGAMGGLNSIIQKDVEIKIDGWFSREEFIYEYALMLADTGHFIEDGVNIQQVILKPEGHTFRIEATLVPPEVEE
jgi:hypothetical protein